MSEKDITLESIRDEVVGLFERIDSRLDYLEAQIEYTQSILGSFHPDPLIRHHCLEHLKKGAEELYSDETIRKIRERFPSSESKQSLNDVFQELVKPSEQSSQYKMLRRLVEDHS